MADKKTFIGWNYDTQVATRYARTGECNLCGDCCKQTIHIRDTFPKPGTPRNTSLEKIPFHSEWVEPEQNNPDRIMWKYHVTTEPSPCTMLIADRHCTIQNVKPKQCEVFPSHPHDIENLPNCSFKFEIVNQWEFQPEDVNHG